jgi:hypothetical protein
VGLTVSSEYEAEADRLRAKMAVTIDELRSNLTPSHLVSETASLAGVEDLSWSGAFDFASKRHPIPTAIIGLGLAFWTLSAVRGRGRRKGLAIRETSSSLVDSATTVFRQRADTKRREFVRAAQVEVAAGAAKLSDEIERRLGGVVDTVPGGIQVRPLIESAIQMALVAMLESLLPRRSQ